MLNGTSRHNIIAAQYNDHVSNGHVLGCLVLTVRFCIYLWCNTVSLGISPHFKRS